jgi:hypothetical protein
LKSILWPAAKPLRKGFLLFLTQRLFSLCRQLSILSLQYSISDWWRDSKGKENVLRCSPRRVREIIHIIDQKDS